MQLDVERRMRTAQHKYCEYGDIVAPVLRTDNGQSHAHRAVPEKQRTEYAACRRTPTRDKGGNPRSQPKGGQADQNAALVGGCPVQVATAVSRKAMTTRPA